MRSVLPLIGIILIGVTLTGCWDWRELETLAIVTGMGIDYVDEKSERLLVTVQVIEPAKMNTAGNGGGGGTPSSPTGIIQAEGDTIFEAVRNLSLRSTRRPFFSHAQVLVIGEEAARRGVDPFLDFVVRDPEPRRTAMLLIVEGRAQDLLRQEVILDQISGLGIDRMFHTALRATSETKVVRIHDYFLRMVSPTTAPLASRIRYDVMTDSLNVEGAAFMNLDGKLVGFLDGSETRGLLWVLGEIEGSLLQFDEIVEGRRVRGSLDVLRASSKIIPSFNNGLLGFRIEVDVQSKLGSLMSPYNVVTVEGMQHLSRNQARTIKDEINLVLAKSREHGLDLLGLGDIVHKAYPKEWRKLSSNWGQMLKELPVEVIVRSIVEEIGLSTMPFASPSRGFAEEGVYASP